MMTSHLGLSESFLCFLQDCLVPTVFACRYVEDSCIHLVNKAYDIWIFASDFFSIYRKYLDFLFFDRQILDI